MTDTLRDRIAAVVSVVGFSDSWATPPQAGEFDYEVADAVIATLGLKTEWSLKSTIYANPLIHPYRSREDAVADRGGASEERRKDLSLMRRYVTEWENDDRHPA